MNKSTFSLQIDRNLIRGVEAAIAQNPRKGCRDVSELTEQLWIAHLERSRTKLLNSSQIAAEMGRSPLYVSAMKAAGYVMRYGNRDVLTNALSWLEAHPEFRTTEYVALSRTGKGRQQLPGALSRLLPARGDRAAQGGSR